MSALEDWIPCTKSNLETKMAQLAQENGTNFEEGVDVGNFLVNVFPISE